MQEYSLTKTLVVAIATFTALAAVKDAQAATIGRGTVETNTGISELLAQPDFLVEIVQLDPSGIDTLPGIPIFAKTITSADVGIPYTVTSANNPNFAQITSLLTNGVSDTVFFGVTGSLSTGVATGVSESAFTLDDDPTDFQGSIIDSLTITVNSFEPNIPGQDPNGDGIWTDYAAEYTLSVQGRPVPEPSNSLGLGLVVSFGILLAKTKRHKKVGA